MFSIMSSRLAGLKQRYSESHRIYHGQRHVDAMLAGLDFQEPHVTNFAALELAIWYHDSVYDLLTQDNEVRSASLMRSEMEALVAPHVLETAQIMIWASADHQMPHDLPESMCEDVATFLDLDMAVLGSAPDVYDAYEAGIAQEYEPSTGRETYRRGRAVFLETALAAERLFHTDRFHEALDLLARDNMRRALRSLYI